MSTSVPPRPHGAPAPHAPTTAKKFWLIVVWPNAQSPANPQGEYTENLIVHHQVQIQDLSSGLYLLRLRQGSREASAKALVVR